MAKREASKVKEGTTSLSQKASLLNWPSLLQISSSTLHSKRATYSKPQTITTYLPRQVYVIDNFLTAAVCENIISFVESNAGPLNFVKTPPPAKGEAVRVNYRASVKNEQLGRECWGLFTTFVNRIGKGDYTNGSLAKECDDQLEKDEDEDLKEFKEQFREARGIFSNIRIYKYDVGQFFDKHYDESVTADYYDAAGKRCKGRTHWTLLIYLTGRDEVEGNKRAESFHHIVKYSDCILIVTTRR